MAERRARAAYRKKLPPLTDEQRAMVEDNLKLVGYVVSRAHFWPYEDEELMQIGTMGLIRAAIEYRPEDATEFSTFAVLCIRTALHHYHKSQLSPCRDVRKANVSLDEIKKNWKGEDHRSLASILTSSDNLDDALIAKSMMDDVNALSDERMRSMVLMRIEGLTFQEIADVYGLTRSRCQQIVRKAQDQLRWRWAV